MAPPRRELALFWEVGSCHERFSDEEIIQEAGIKYITPYERTRTPTATKSVNINAGDIKTY